jgi:hypothetical protein
MNWLNYLSDHAGHGMEIRVFTRSPQSGMQKYNSPAKPIKIDRSANPKSQNFVYRYWGYLNFYFSTITKMVLWKPDILLYYETLSSFPAIVYKKIFNSRCCLLVHYHEYTSQEEYKNEMILNRWWHALEKKTYPLYQWVSHTNQDRMELFLKDNKKIMIPNTHVLPNYPPAGWQKKNIPDQIGLPVKFVYVGALSLETMYVKEFAEWVSGLNGKATWDIYSNNIAEDAKLYFSLLQNKNIHFHGGVNYYLLPGIFKNYQVGVILYKGHIPNYVYNVPNKLFEYFACGLDVWFPHSMKSSLPYATENHYPKILAVDFGNLDQLNLLSAVSHLGLVYKASSFYANEQFDYFLKTGLQSCMNLQS